MIRPEEVIEAYLREVDRRLPGSRWERREVLDELHDGLLEAVHSRDADLAESHAVERAIAEFGPAEEVSAALAFELVLRIAHRVAWRIVIVTLACGTVWLVYRTAAGAPSGVAPSSGWALLLFAGATSSLKLMAGIAQLSALALLALRELRQPPRRPIGLLSEVIMVAIGVCLLDVIVIAMAVSPRWPTGMGWPVSVAVVVAFSWALAQSAKLVRAAAAG